MENLECGAACLAMFLAYRGKDSIECPICHNMIVGKEPELAAHIEREHKDADHFSVLMVY